MAGEISIDAMIAGEYDAPVIFVSTDDFNLYQKGD